MDNAARVGAYMMDRLLEMQQRYEIIGDVRGRGLMLAAELVQDRQTKERASELRNRIVKACYYRGLLILGCGANSIRFCPPLVVTESEVDEALSILDEAIQACLDE